jgi:hypothetical protein
MAEAYDPAVDLGDETEALGDGEEARGHHEFVVGADHADEQLELGGVARGGLHYGLGMEGEEVFLQGGADALDPLQAGLDAG